MRSFFFWVSRGSWAQWQNSLPGERESELGRETFDAANEKRSFSAELGDVWHQVCLLLSKHRSLLPLTRLKRWRSEETPCGDEVIPSSVTEVGMRLHLRGTGGTPACLEDKMSWVRTKPRKDWAHTGWALWEATEVLDLMRCGNVMRKEEALRWEDLSFCHDTWMFWTVVRDYSQGGQLSPLQSSKRRGELDLPMGT